MYLGYIQPKWTYIQNLHKSKHNITVLCIITTKITKLLVPGKKWLFASNVWIAHKAISRALFIDDQWPCKVFFLFVQFRCVMKQMHINKDAKELLSNSKASMF